MKTALKSTLTNFIKISALLAASLLLVFLAGLLPESKMGGTNLRVFVFSVVQSFILFLASDLTGHIYGAACIAFVMPVVGYYWVGMMSPIFMAVLIFANCMLVLFNVVSLQRNNYLCRGIGLALGSLARYGSLWLLCKLAVSQIEMIKMTQNVVDEAGMEQGAALIREQFVSGQLLATLVGGLIAFAVAPAILAVYPSGKPVTAEDAAAQKREKEKSQKQARQDKTDGAAKPARLVAGGFAWTKKKSGAKSKNGSAKKN